MSQINLQDAVAPLPPFDDPWEYPVLSECSDNINWFHIISIKNKVPQFVVDNNRYPSQAADFLDQILNPAGVLEIF